MRKRNKIAYKLRSITAHWWGATTELKAEFWLPTPPGQSNLLPASRMNIDLVLTDEEATIIDNAIQSALERTMAALQTEVKDEEENPSN